ncbi:hypothetical protein SAMN05421854_106354 [Amycolatopsis rubida]|uniref:SDR family NAD(P)-dependent oxidoreductase n=1 Tax=Amycolatopsis rubida TaxID=112413 RepID=A0A1I5SKJ4_9PSEU|nr:hypothetical protein SAMN05421854_106354 [Amycolatopsis rubida]
MNPRIVTVLRLLAGSERRRRKRRPAGFRHGACFSAIRRCPSTTDNRFGRLAGKDRLGTRAQRAPSTFSWPRCRGRATGLLAEDFDRTTRHGAVTGAGAGRTDVGSGRCGQHAWAAFPVRAQRAGRLARCRAGPTLRRADGTARTVSPHRWSPRGRPPASFETASGPQETVTSLARRTAGIGRSGIAIVRGRRRDLTRKSSRTANLTGKSLVTGAASGIGQAGALAFRPSRGVGCPVRCGRRRRDRRRGSGAWCEGAGRAHRRVSAERGHGGSGGLRQSGLRPQQRRHFAPGLLTDLDEAEWHRVVAGNLTGVFLCVKYVIASRGAIVTPSSVWD